MSKGWIYLAETSDNPAKILSYGLFEEANPRTSDLNDHIQQRFRNTKEKPRISYAIYCDKVKDVHGALQRNKVVSKSDLIRKLVVITKTLDVVIYQKVNPSLRFSNSVSKITETYEGKASEINRFAPYMYLLWFSWPIPLFLYYLHILSQEEDGVVKPTHSSSSTDFSMGEVLGGLFGFVMFSPILIIILWGVFILGPSWFFWERKDNTKKSVEIKERHNDRIREIGKQNYRTTAEINAVLIK